MPILIVLTLFVLISAPFARAGNDFGTRAESIALADALVEVVEAGGIASAIAAVHDPMQPFAASRLGINLFHGSVEVADNREPEMVSSDYAETADLTGTPMWPLVTRAADVGDEAVLLWYHYDTQETYRYHCYSKRARRDDALVMVCR